MVAEIDGKVFVEEEELHKKEQLCGKGESKEEPTARNKSS